MAKIRIVKKSTGQDAALGVADYKKWQDRFGEVDKLLQGVRANALIDVASSLKTAFAKDPEILGNKNPASIIAQFDSSTKQLRDILMQAKRRCMEISSQLQREN